MPVFVMAFAGFVSALSRYRTSRLAEGIVFSLSTATGAARKARV